MKSWHMKSRDMKSGDMESWDICSASPFTQTKVARRRIAAQRSKRLSSCTPLISLISEGVLPLISKTHSLNFKGVV